MHEIALKLKKFLGDSKSNRFINALRTECKQKERLMYWQEKALEIFYEEYRIKKLNMAEWDQILPDVWPPPPTKIEIIEDALSEIAENGIEAFESSKEIGRNLWKTCDLESDKKYLKRIEPHMDLKDQIRLYEILRTYGVPETYWRDNFKVIFPKTRGRLPKILDVNAFSSQINDHMKFKFKNLNAISILIE